MLAVYWIYERSRRSDEYGGPGGAQMDQERSN
jgi:hypothetical protein